MKLKPGFLVREVAGQTVALPCGDPLDLDLMIRLNGTAALLWRLLESETDENALVAALLAEYDVDEPTARRAVADFVAKLHENGFLC